MTEPSTVSQQSLPLGESLTEQPRFSHLTPPEPTAVFDTYWRFAVERQEIFYRRLKGLPSPWTDDPVLRSYRFTNVYRASDRVSQYLINHVIYNGEQIPAEIFFRTILFKLFNRIETWEFLETQFGVVSWADYNFHAYDKALTQAVASGAPIYSAAYIMPSGGRRSTHRYKHSMHLSLLEKMMRENIPQRITDASSMKEAFDLMKFYPTIGDFLAYQYVTDLNYSTLTDFSEMDFTVAGPGALDGISKCFSHCGSLTESDVIRWMVDQQDEVFEKLDLAFCDLWGRPLQLIDAQNLFCEVSKYARVMHPEIAGLARRTRIKQRYAPKNCAEKPCYPPKWKLNDAIERWFDTEINLTSQPY